MSIRADIQHYFEKHSNEKIYLKDLATTLEVEERPLQSAISHLIRDGYELEIVARGQCWIYKPNNAKAGSGFMAIITTTPKGSQILEDDDGSLWIARKFEE
jgi:hypothetical protein